LRASGSPDEGKELIIEVRKGVWGMPRLSEAKKDVISCEKLRGSANRSYIRRCPNGATHHAEGMVSAAMQRQTRGTETSKYPEEKKTTVIAPVVASERARAQTFSVTAGEGL
jgi:hypothetical protein